MAVPSGMSRPVGTPPWALPVIPPIRAAPGAKDEPGNVPVVQLPVAGNESVGAGATKTAEQVLGSFFAVAILVNIPPDVTGFLDVDGRRLVNSADGEGLQGCIPLGDFAARVGVRMSLIKASFTNAGSAAQDARFILVGLP